MSRVFSGLVALLVLVAAPAAAQESGTLSWLVGEWHGTGTMFGNPSEAALSVRPVLGGRFIELSYRAGRFEGRAMYRSGPEGRWQAQWFDNRGLTFPIEARESERTLTADWGSPDTEQGRTVYLLAADGRLTVTDSVRRGGDYRVFASHVLEKAD